MGIAPMLWRLARRLDKALSSRGSVDQWIILTGRAGYGELDWRRLRPLLPPLDRYWADPFVVQRGERHYVFIEEKLYETGLGRIACLTLDAEGKMERQQTVLEKSYHLSYPFLWEQGGELFMIPESAEHRTIELYRCSRFPERWEFVKNLMTDVYAVDSTLLEWDSRLWLFTNIKAQRGSSLDQLHLFSAPELLADHWQAHPQNPIVKDIRSARPAGRIFRDGDRLIRPSQDSLRRYGYALRFNRIETLNEREYVERPKSCFTPRGSPYLAAHTFNQAGGLTVIDAVMRRRKK